ncbi:NAD(P)-dependent oxidoreductase [Alicyclobacillus mengziensis]|uniref:NAD(P)-dependent oxidoreductase n=1 Tax=Alicyclobacillus mengziensis TaxID=2931921 RepID=A0A9X7W308_9BACL|nr:NAD(P)-dependent oxidoreductase [Alicyclobacillus mengziensis]QSO49798.1 NAD(P)-dependent oxidoreductase [Alicyclobacillus mengziensis]
MRTVGFIGTGVMGSSMALRILQSGYRVLVFTRTRSKASSVLQAGAEWANSISELVIHSDVVITMVGFPKDVEEVYFGENGIFQSAKPGMYLIDMTTSSPGLADRIGRVAVELNIHALDAPVSGGDVGARDGTLSIMVGGEERAFTAMKPIFDILGKNVVYHGPSGAGQHTKMCNQIAIASNMIGVCEAIAYAKEAGLDPDRVLQSISSGAAGSWSLTHLAPRMIQGDMKPGFYIKHFIKDMGIALDEAKKMHMDTPGLEMALNLYKHLSDLGYGELGTQALYNMYSK